MCQLRCPVGLYEVTLPSLIRNTESNVSATAAAALPSL
jgi:hypothetical protein